MQSMLRSPAALTTSAVSTKSEHYLEQMAEPPIASEASDCTLGSMLNRAFDGVLNAPQHLVQRASGIPDSA